MEQEITYHPSRNAYRSTRDSLLSRMRRGDTSAFVNLRAGPWMIVSTTAAIGFEVKGIGASTGRRYLRQISAAEEALYIFEREQAEQQ